MREFVRSMLLPLLGCVGLLSIILNIAEPKGEYAPIDANPGVWPAAAYQANARASDYFMAYMVPLPPAHQRGEAIAQPVYFVEQEGIDHYCGGKNEIVACAIVNGSAMAVPNPCQARFAGESYAAVLCHEKGHLLGWRHEE